MMDAISCALRSNFLGHFLSDRIALPTGGYDLNLRRPDSSQQYLIEKHYRGSSLNQIVELELEVTELDICNMQIMKGNASLWQSKIGRKIHNLPHELIKNWDLNQLATGERFKYEYINGSQQHTQSYKQTIFDTYLAYCEIYSRLHSHYGMPSLGMPMLYFGSNRSAQEFEQRLEMAEYNLFESMSDIERANSRTSGVFFNAAIKRLAHKYLKARQIHGESIAEGEFRNERDVAGLLKYLKKIDFDFSVETLDELKNLFHVRLKKGERYIVSSALSSGERQLLNFLFTIFGLGVRHALVIIDEPELHLHPKWQKMLVEILEDMASETKNQFVISTHSPAFITPKSIHSVTRVYMDNESSYLKSKHEEHLPELSSLIRIVNSHNNEKIFFADAVILVEGVGDRIFWEKIWSIVSPKKNNLPVVEFVDVGGKTELKKYKDILDAYCIKHATLADLDYIEQIGPPSIKACFKADTKKLLNNVVANPKSTDGEVLCNAIEKATSCDDLAELKNIWPAIRSRYRRMAKMGCTSLEPEISKFIEDKSKEGMFLLPKGNLEAYLPKEYSRKNIGELVQFTEF